jgi:hypothetical protein
MERKNSMRFIKVGAMGVLCASLFTWASAMYFKPGVDDVGTGPGFIPFRKSTPSPMDPVLLERATAQSAKSYSPAGGWIKHNTEFGKSLNPAEANSVGKMIVKRIFEAPDRTNNILKTDKGVMFLSESAEVGAGVKFRAGKFLEFTHELSENVGPPSKSQLTDVGQIVANYPKSEAPTVAEIKAYGKTYIDLVMDSPNRHNVVIKNQDGSSTVKVDAPEIGVTIQANLKTNQFELIRNGPQGPQPINPDTMMSKQLAIEYKNKVAGLLEFKGTYRRENIASLQGFERDAPTIVAKQGMTMAEFERWFAEPARIIPESMIPKMKAIRDAVPMPTPDTLLEKAVPLSNIQHYLNGQIRGVKGFINRAQDTRGLTDFRKIYNTLRLDYMDSNFNDVSDTSLGIIRFKTSEVATIGVPYSPEFGGKAVGDYPFTGNGFTATGNGKIIPEFKIGEKNGVKILGGSEIYELDRWGTEKLVGVYDEEKGRFFKIK